MKLAEYRKSKMLSQDKLAKLAGVTKQTVFDIEHGKSCRLKTIIKISNALEYNLNADELVEITPYIETMPVAEAKKLAEALNINFDVEGLFTN